MASQGPQNTVIEFQFARRTSFSQILLALGKSGYMYVILMIHVEDDLPDPLPIAQVRMKSYLPGGKSTCPGQPYGTFFEP